MRLAKVTYKKFGNDDGVLYVNVDNIQSITKSSQQNDVFIVFKNGKDLFVIDRTVEEVYTDICNNHFEI